MVNARPPRTISKPRLGIADYAQRSVVWGAVGLTVCLLSRLRCQTDAWTAIRSLPDRTRADDTVTEAVSGASNLYDFIGVNR